MSADPPPSAAERARTSEYVVLLDESGRAVGRARKDGVHHADTPLHLAFSCYLFDGVGRVLVTRRALGKATWPGAWTNSCCGHPAPGERVEEAVRRRVREELGVGLVELRLLLPDFRYRAVMPDGVVEHELCPVLVAVTHDQVRPDPDEVADYEWVDWTEFRNSVLDGSRSVSPWCVRQVQELPADPVRAPGRAHSDLPPAAR